MIIYQMLNGKFTMNNKQEIRRRLLRELKSKWKDNNYLGFARLSPGTGKSYMIINIIKDHIRDCFKSDEIPKIIILVSSRTLRDKTFIEEIEKWWCKKDFEQYCEITCYQSQMKISNQKYSLGIADEGDVMLSDGFVKGYHFNVYEKFLSLSGTYNKEKLEIARKLFGDILLDYSVKDAQKEGLLNKTKIILYPVPLLTVNNIKTKNGFWSEAKQMKWIDEKIESLRKTSFLLYRAIEAKQEEFNKKPNQNKKEILKLKKEYQKTLSSKKFLESGNGKSSRLNILYNLKSTQLASTQLQEELLKENTNKVLLFSERTSILDSICKENVFYGNKPESILDKFNRGIIRFLGVSKKIERGFNFKNLNHLIFQSFNGGESNFTQRLGRIMRLETDQIATLHVMVSYYYSKGEIIPARNNVWFKNAIEALGLEYEVNKKFMK